MNLLLKPWPTHTAASTPPGPMYRFTVRQYHAMIEAGILTEDDPCELLDGWVVEKMPHNPPHDGTILIAQTALLSRLTSDWVLRVQSSVTLAKSEPEPDLVVARGPIRRYLGQHPTPKDVGLLIEVANSTLAADRDFKGFLYARARIPCYWIINLIDVRVEVYTDPRAGKSPSYRRRRDYGVGQSVPLVLDGREIALIPVREFLQ